MPNFKTLLMILSVLTLSFLVIGCGMLTTPEAEPEDTEAAQEGELPEWLLSEHRTAQTEDEEPIKPKDPEDEEEPEPAEETAEPEPVEAEPEEEQVAQEETDQDHVVEADIEEPEETAPEEETPQPEQVTNQSWQRGTYTGEWLDGQPHGEGTFTHPSGGELTGTWVDGNPDGQFTLTDPDGETSTVHFQQGQIAEAEDYDEEEEAWWQPGGGSGGDWF